MLVNDAITAKNVALRSAGALRAIQASIGIIAIWPSGDSSAVSMRAMKRASTTPPVACGPFVKAVVHADVRQRENAGGNVSNTTM